LFNIATFKPEVKRKLPLLSCCFNFYWTYLPEVCILYEDLLLLDILQVCTAVMVVLLILEDYQLEKVIFSGGVV